MFNKYLSAAVVALLCAAGTAQAADAPHIPGIMTESTIYPNAIIQDVSSRNIVVGKIIRDDFNTIVTTVTLDLQQDSRGKVVGTAVVTTTHPTGGATFDVTGKVKAKNGVRGFTLKGKANVGEEAKKTPKLTIKATQIGFEGVDLSELPPNSTDFKSTATYDIAVKTSGLEYDYNYLQWVVVAANHHISFETTKPEDSDRYGLPDSDKFDYYRLYTPWGITLAKGTVQNIFGDGYFTLKAPQFSYTEIDYGFDGSFFDTEWVVLSTPIGKYDGPASFVVLPDATLQSSSKSAGGGSGLRGPAAK